MTPLWSQREYDVVAQKRRGDAIQVIGSVWAQSRQLAVFYAMSTYDEERWHLLYVVDKADQIPIIVGGRPVANQRGATDGSGTDVNA